MQNEIDWEKLKAMSTSTEEEEVRELREPMIDAAVVNQMLEITEDEFKEAISTNLEVRRVPKKTSE